MIPYEYWVLLQLYNEHQNWYLDRNNIVNTTDEITINLSLRFGLSAQEKILLEPSIIKAKTLQTIDAAFDHISKSPRIKSKRH